MVKNILVFLSLSYFILITSSSVFSQALEDSFKISGKVFIDDNKNGIIEKGERGVSKILISNGVDIVSTDKKGNYTIDIRRGQSIFPILPAEYKLIKRLPSNVLNSQFYYIHPENNRMAKASHSFPLEKQEVVDQFKVGAIGDIQVDNKDEISYAAKSFFTEINNRHDLAFNIVLGDLVNDKMELMKDMSNLLAVSKTPSWTLVGNHDRNVNNPDAMNDVFNSYFGADTYAFNYGNVHFIVLNNVFATGKRTYEGRISDQQLQFVKNDLAHVEKSKTIVISQHIPMMGTRNRNDLFQLLEGFDNVLFLSGHTHVVSRHFYNNGQLHEIGAGAVCGTWWRGEKNSDEIPEALMQCGSPRGYVVINFDKNGYKFDYKAVGFQQEKQMNISVNKDTLVANVFLGSDSTTVSYQLNNDAWLDMKKVRMTDPNVLKIVENNKSKVYPTTGNTANPLRTRNSNHVWEGYLKNFQTNKPNVLRIKAVDKYGFDVIEEFVLFP